MAAGSLALLVLLVASCTAQVVSSPPIEMLGPLTNDFPRKGPAIVAEDTWEELTAGRNLALGKPYRFSREPNYGSTRDEGDATQLTDGEIIPGDHIWYHKKAVGYAGCEPPAVVCIDLGEVQPIDAVVAHVQGGGAHSASLRYPLRFDVYVSDDDDRYYLVDSVSKKQYVDQKGSLFDLPEDAGAYPPGAPHTHAFNFGNLKTRGRYVALQMTFAAAYNALDEIAVIAGDHDPDQVTLDENFATQLTFDGVELLYPLPHLQVPTNVAGGFSLAVRDSREDKSGPVTCHISMPVGVKLWWPGGEEAEPTDSSDTHSQYSLTLEGPLSGLGYLYVRADAPVSGEMLLHAECDTFTQPRQRVKLLPIEIPSAPALKQLFLALGWTGVDVQRKWPGAPEALAHLGLTHASVGSWETPAHYERPETAEGQRWLDEDAREAGLKVCMTDSPFHIGESLWRREPEFAEAYMQTDPPQKRLCLSYRSQYYQREIQRIVQRYRYRKPEFVFFDVECFGGANKRAAQCARCSKLLEERGCTPEELVTDLYAETARNIAEALNAAADEMGRPHPTIGYYHVGPGYIYHNIFDFAKMYPAGVQVANPEVYVRCWPPAVAEIVRKDKATCPPECKVITWTSPGTLNWEGECPPARFFDALMETFFNGAIGTLYYTPKNLSPGDLLAQSHAACVVAPVEDIIHDSELAHGAVSADGEAHISAIRSGDEMLVLVADFQHLGDRQIDVKVSVDGPVEVIDLFTRKRITTLTPDQNSFSVKVSGAYRTRPFYIGSRWADRADM